jgi:beta-lactam-binding protein with PASTA domain
MFKFITSRPLWVNIAAAAVLTILLIFLVLRMLGWITRHGEYLTVPAVVGQKTDDAIKLLEKQGFDVQIQDSIFTDTAARGIVLKQLPDPNATVKINRTVFITVNRVIPPMVDMPKLEGQSLSFALDLLRRNHLLLGDTIFKPDFQAGSVLQQLYNGTHIAENAKVQWGSRITLVVGSGLGDEQIAVPDITGMSFRDAKAFLEENGIILGAVLPDPDVRDTASAFVYLQNPARLDEEKRLQYIRSGQVMDLRLSVQMKMITDSLDNKQ